jgi:hypothetical protein
VYIKTLDVCKKKTNTTLCYTTHVGSHRLMYRIFFNIFKDFFLKFFRRFFFSTFSNIDVNILFFYPYYLCCLKQLEYFVTKLLFNTKTSIRLNSNLGVDFLLLFFVLFRLSIHVFLFCTNNF